MGKGEEEYERMKGDEKAEQISNFSLHTTVYFRQRGGSVVIPIQMYREGNVNKRIRILSDFVARFGGCMILLKYTNDFPFTKLELENLINFIAFEYSRA